MIVSKFIEITLNSRNINYYKLKGYEIRSTKDSRGRLAVKRGTKIIIDINDLPQGSNVKIHIKCDRCEKELKLPFYSYNQYLHDGKYYCKKCATKDRIENGLNTRLEKGKSFEKWCIENNRQDVLRRWDYKLNIKKPGEILCGTHGKYYFKCPRGLHDSELKNIGNFTSGSDGVINCVKCNSFAQWGIDIIDKDFLSKYWNVDKNNKLNINPWEIFKSSSTKVWIYCQDKKYHESYSVTCGNFYMGYRCPYCATFRGKVHPLDSLGKVLDNKDLLHIWSNKNKESPYSLTPRSNRKVWWKCENNKHNDYERNVGSSSSICDFRCPECMRERSESLMQEKVRKYLEGLGYTILHEHNCTIVPKNPKTKNNLPFDNEVEELKLIIEVHGEQHYKKSSGWYNNDLSKRKLYDRYKRMYAKCNGYNYLEIPYWTNDSNETWKILINNKIGVIKNESENY